MDYPKITFTVTTCNRINLFKETMDSFLLMCLDLDLIDRWIVSDDHSTESDFKQMQEWYPFMEFHRSPQRGQASNLNNLFSKVETDWFFHCEDDWEFIKKGYFIREMFDVTNDDIRIKNVTLRHWVGNPVTSKDDKFEYNVHRFLPLVKDPKIVYTQDSRWFGYTLNPGLQHKFTVDLLGQNNVDHDSGCRFWDRTAAIKYLALGLKRANLNAKYIEHIGENRSAYAQCKKRGI